MRQVYKRPTQFLQRRTMSGFTLVELMVSMFLILSVTSVVMAIFVAGLRGTTRSSNEDVVRQNGDLALSQVTRMIRNAKNLNGLKTAVGAQLAPSCYVASEFGPTPTPIVYKVVEVTAFDGGVTEIACPATGEATITSKSASLATPLPLTDTNKVTIIPESCYFVCQQDSPTDLPVISVGFTVQSKSGATSIDQKVEQVFQTSVVPRNFVR